MDTFWFFVIAGGLGIFVWLSTKPVTTKRRLGDPPWRGDTKQWRDIKPPRRKWDGK